MDSYDITQQLPPGAIREGIVVPFIAVIEMVAVEKNAIFPIVNARNNHLIHSFTDEK